MPDGTAMRRIAFMNQKGGVGKTTSTVNIAAGMARAGRRVLLVDLDPQAHATLHLGLDPDAHLERGSVYDTLLDPDFNVLGAIHAVDDGLGLLPAETALAAAETELASADDRHHRLASALARLDGMFDDIVLDCPPSLGLLTLNGLCAAREVIIPMQAHFLALQGVGKLFETVLLVQSQSNPELSVSGIVLCMHDAQTTHTQEVVADLEEFLDAQRDEPVPWNRAVVFRPPVRRNIKLAECPSFGQTIFDYAPTAAGADDYKALAEAVMRYNASATPQPTQPDARPGGDPGTSPQPRTEAHPEAQPIEQPIDQPGTQVEAKPESHVENPRGVNPAPTPEPEVRVMPGVSPTAPAPAYRNPSVPDQASA